MIAFNIQYMRMSEIAEWLSFKLLFHILDWTLHIGRVIKGI